MEVEIKLYQFFQNILIFTTHSDYIDKKALENLYVLLELILDLKNFIKTATA